MGNKKNHKSICISFLGNIDYDSRTRNIYQTLKAQNYIVNVISFDWLTNNFNTQLGEVTIYKLSKNFSSLLFYIKFSTLLLKRLINIKSAIYFAEDIYTLPIVTIFAKLKGAKVFYDCRELFGYLAGLKKRKFLQFLLKIIERLFITHVDLIITTGELDSEFIEKEYGLTKTIVIRNLPKYYKPLKPINFCQLLNIPTEKKILLYQGVVLHGRGLKYIFEALTELKNYVLIILGAGEELTYYKSLSKKLVIENQIYFLGKIKQNELLKYTAGADIGLSLIENLSLSYYYALPNKLFEYVMAEIPVLVSNLPQMEKVVNTYEIGLTVKDSNTEEIKNALKKLEEETFYKKIKNNCKKASNDLNWENEVKKLLSFLS
ncbi:MAG: glycosyltransferase [Bacteroidetes bacterium]|nr:glycosyltransferase [Bacteroidota bacterium]